MYPYAAAGFPLRRGVFLEGSKGLRLCDIGGKERKKNHGKREVRMGFSCSYDIELRSKLKRGSSSLISVCGIHTRKLRMGGPAPSFFQPDVMTAIASWAIHSSSRLQTLSDQPVCQ